MRRIFIIIVFMFLSVSACQNNTSDNTNHNNEVIQEFDAALQELENAQSEKDHYSGLLQQTFDAYRAMFVIEFTGSEYEWEYQLTTRKNNDFMEYYFYLEGIEGEKNPGAVRLVTDGESSWMIGPGTDELCFRFPNSLQLGPVFLTPDNLFNPEHTNQSLIEAGIETLFEQKTTHYTVRDGQISDWTNLSIDIWSNDTRIILTYLGNAMGEDPLFDAGNGFLNFSYILLEIGDQIIEPILGCEIDYPLPENVQNITSFPGLASFENGEQVNNLVDFYKQTMKDHGWKAVGKQEEIEGITYLTFKIGEKEVLISFRSEANHSIVEILEK